MLLKTGHVKDKIVTDLPQRHATRQWNKLLTEIRRLKVALWASL